MKIKILSTSDVHGHLFPTNFSQIDDYHPFGYLKATSVIEQARQKAADDELVIYVENGDFIEGSPLTDYVFRTRDEFHFNHQLNQLVNHLHPDAAVLGNHEFNYGIKYLKETWNQRNFPILSANLTGSAVQSISNGPYTIIDFKGTKVAILGLTTQYIPHWESADHLDDVKFKSAFETAQYWVPKLHEKADLVIVAYHGGFERDLQDNLPTEKLTGENEGAEMLNNIPGIDALITGHQHREISTVVNGTPVTQPGYRGSNVGEITLELNSNKQIVHSAAQLIPTADYPVEPKLAQIAKPIQDQVESWLDQPLAKVDGDMHIKDPMQARLYGNAYLDFVNRVQMDATQTDVAGTALFNNEITGFDNQVTIRNVLNSYIFPNTLVVEKLSGADIKATLERCASFFELNDDQSISVAKEFSYPKVQYFNYDYYSGIEYTFDLRQPKGHRVTDLKYHGQPLLADQELEVTMNQYRGMGAGDFDMFSVNKVVRSYADDVPKLIMNYLQKHQIIQAHQPNNLKIIK